MKTPRNAERSANPTPNAAASGGDAREQWVPLAGFEHNGQSCTIDPWGEVIAGPLSGEGLLFADTDPARLAQAKLACDPAGHYARADLFELKVAGGTIFGRAHKLGN